MPTTLPERPPIEAAEESTPPVRRRGSRSFSYAGQTREDAVKAILADLQSAIDERQDWLTRRMVRYAKYRGWSEDPDALDWASNQHIPVMIANALRAKAGLFNAVMAIRPVMDGKPHRKDLKDTAERAGQLIDYQVFQEANGHRVLEQYIEQFVDDSVVLSYQPWVKDRRRLVDIKTLDRPLESLDLAMPPLLEALLPGTIDLSMQRTDGTAWLATLPPQGDDPEREISVEVYDKDEQHIEVVCNWLATTYDGPAIIVQALEDFVVPLRSQNAQPITPQNPFGAPWVARLIRIHRDSIRRLIKDGVYDLVTEAKLDEYVGEPRVPTDTPGTEDELKTYKDAQEGRGPDTAATADARDWFTLVEWYGAMDVNGDGLQEDVIFWIIREIPVLVRQRYLTELYTGLPIRRPISEARFIPVPGQFYGMGMIELMEGMHDLIHQLVNQALDNGRLANLPFGFYRASSGLKAEQLSLEPGTLYPIDNPQQDITFPPMSHADQTFFFNMLGLAMQWLDRESQIGPIQMGQVPQGKASALRTTGTTMALLQQGAAMPEQILRRLFFGLKDIWEQIHLLNRRFLPPKKNFLIAGRPLDQDDAYARIEDRAEIDVPLTFEWQATLLNTNKGVMQQTLTALGMALFNPLSMQFGVVGPEQFYNYLKDLVQAGQLDPARYLIKPLGVPEGPRHTAQEAILMIMEDRMPEVAPLEPIEQHAQILQSYSRSPQFGFLTQQQVGLFKAYLMAVMQMMAQQQQQQQMMQAAQQFSQGMGGGGQSVGGRPSEPGEAPEIQTQTPTLSEVMGAEQRSR